MLNLILLIMLLLLLFILLAIRAIYDAVQGMGFEGGRILEPSMGVGNFFGMLPEALAGSELYGVELDSITGRIAQKLYPDANIKVAGFETTKKRDFYDLAVGNVPFGQYQVHDVDYNRLGFNIHNYFFAKALDQVRPGGVVAFVTSRFTMDSRSTEVRRYLAERAELLGAIRLPNNAFRANAGTDVVSDILFLQRRDEIISQDNERPAWVETAEVSEGVTVNRYFAEHPEMVLGTLELESTRYGQDVTCTPIPGAGRHRPRPRRAYDHRLRRRGQRQEYVLEHHRQGAGKLQRQNFRRGADHELRAEREAGDG